MDAEWTFKSSNAASAWSDARILAHHEALGLFTSPVVGSKPLAVQIQERIHVIRDAFDVDAVVVRTLHGDYLNLLAAVGVPAENLWDRIPSNLGMVDYLINEQATLTIEDFRTDEKTAVYAWAEQQGKPAFEFIAYAGAPLIVESQVLGCIGLYCTQQQRQFSQIELGYLRIVANHLAISIVNDRLYRRLEEKAEQLRQQITEREALEAQLLQGRKLEAVGQLAGGIAHDFNNLLTVIIGNLQLSADIARDSLGLSHPIQNYLSEIEQAAQRAGVLTRQVLTFSRKNVALPTSVNLNHVITDLTAMLSRLITENIELETRLDHDLATVWIDAGQIEQAVVNMVVNATHAMPNGGQLVLETRNLSVDETLAKQYADLQPGQYVTLIVSDTGIGIEPETLERIFEPFFTTKGPDRGTGLGLSTVHGIVKQADGQITVQSKPGHGTTFTIHLPAFHDPEDIESDKKRAPLATGHETILVCEDDHGVRNMVVKNLQNAGYQVIAVENAEAGLASVKSRSKPIDLLISDVIMPGMNGRIFSERIRKILPNLPTLFISGYTASIIEHQGKLEDGICFLEKPFTRTDLLRKIREVLDRKSTA